MREGIFLFLCLFGILVSKEDIVDKQVPGQDRVDVLVKQLAGVIEKEGAVRVVEELVRVFKEVGDDTEVLTNEIWSLLKKLRGRTGKNKRIMPTGLIRLLKAKMTVNGKKNILEKVLKILQNETLAENISSLGDGLLVLQLTWVPPVHQSYAAVAHAENRTNLIENIRSPAVNLQMSRLQLEWVPPPSQVYFVQNHNQTEINNSQMNNSSKLESVKNSTNTSKEALNLVHSR
jgi:hypothetical protein